MQKTAKTSFLIIGILMFSAVHAAITLFNYSTGINLPAWFFRNDGTGNAWLVKFDNASLNADQLVWAIDIETIWTAVFSANSKILPPVWGNSTRDCWLLTGTLQSPNGWTVWLASGTLTNGVFNPLTQKLEGYGWNNWIWKVPLGDPVWCNDSYTANIWTGVNRSSFIWRVFIIGNIWGKWLFQTVYKEWNSFDSVSFNSKLQAVKKNIGLLSRNISDLQKNQTFFSVNSLGNKILYINESSTLKKLRISQVVDFVWSSSRIQSIIVVWWDIIIDVDVIGWSVPLAIISTKNQSDVWWDIYIASNVKKIESSLIAEWSLKSWEDEGLIYNDSALKLLTLPANQLYIKWSVISKNTIGWASKTGTPYCPYVANCNLNSATIYDLNYFRSFWWNEWERAYFDATKDAYSVIIEYDSRILSNPPPGF